MNTKSRRSLTLLGMTLAIGLLLPGQAAAHCDTLDGPVVADARTALAQENVAPVLKWVSPADEKEIRTAFANTTAVRKLSPEAETLADLYFFEALVRIHRAGEGAPYTGIHRNQRLAQDDSLDVSRCAEGRFAGDLPEDVLGLDTACQGHNGRVQGACHETNVFAQDLRPTPKT